MARSPYGAITPGLSDGIRQARVAVGSHSENLHHVANDAEDRVLVGVGKYAGRADRFDWRIWARVSVMMNSLCKREHRVSQPLAPKKRMPEI